MIRQTTSGKSADLQTLQSSLAQKMQENEELLSQISLLESKLKKLMDESKNIEGLHEEIANLKEQVRTLDKQLFEFKIKN